MDDASPPSHDGSNSHRDQSQDTFNELRELLLEPERQELRNLQKAFEELRLDPVELSRTLPEALVHRPKPDQQLSTMLFPFIEQGIQVSIKKNRDAFVEAISPAMLPAIRKAISLALQDMMQSLNQTLEYSFTLRGLQWRWEAMRTGKPLAEIVLLHTLLYRVEQVFLIHRETGLVLRHVVADGVAKLDPEAASGMMTAIRDFVRDAFQAGDDATLDTFQVGELTVWVEQGTSAYLAALVRGHPLERDARERLQDTLVAIHREYDEALDGFQGDNLPFETAEPILEACLLIQRAERTRQLPAEGTQQLLAEGTQQLPTERRRQRSPMFVWLGGGVILVALGLGLGNWLRAPSPWDRYVEKLQNLPGIVVTRAEKNWGRYRINGLRDPLALDPNQLLKAEKIPEHKVISVWEPYQALYPEFVLKRVQRVLQPPDTVRLVWREGALVALGSAPRAWIDRARDLMRGFPGVQTWRDGDLNVIE